MADRRSEQFEVFINNGGGISITQENSYDEDSIVVLSVDQAPLLIQWLYEIYSEATSKASREDEVAHDT